MSNINVIARQSEQLFRRLRELEGMTSDLASTLGGPLPPTPTNPSRAEREPVGKLEQVAAVLMGCSDTADSIVGHVNRLFAMLAEDSPAKTALGDGGSINYVGADPRARPF
jgi:hypothetical protein